MSVCLENGSVALLRQEKENLIDEWIEFEATRPIMTTSTAVKNKIWPDFCQKIPVSQNNAHFFEGIEGPQECSNSSEYSVKVNISTVRQEDLYGTSHNDVQKTW